MKNKTTYEIVMNHNYIRIIEQFGKEKPKSVSIDTCVLRTIVQHMKVAGLLSEKTEQHYMKNADHINKILINVNHLGDGDTNISYQKLYTVKIQKGGITENTGYLIDDTPKIKWDDVYKD